jgi:hypothetical protein
LKAKWTVATAKASTAAAPDMAKGNPAFFGVVLFCVGVGLLVSGGKKILGASRENAREPWTAVSCTVDAGRGAPTLTTRVVQDCVKYGEARRRRRTKPKPCVSSVAATEWFLSAPVVVAGAEPSPSPRWLAEPPRTVCSGASGCDRVWTRTNQTGLLAQLTALAASPFDCWYEPDFPSNAAMSSGQGKRDAAAGDDGTAATSMLIAGSILTTAVGFAVCRNLRSHRAKQGKLTRAQGTEGQQRAVAAAPADESESCVALTPVRTAHLP